MKYEYGPDVDFRISTTGTMREYNGSYERMNEQEKYLLQTLCHALYQIKADILNSEAELLKLGNIMIHHVGNSYSIYTRNGLTMLNVYETGYFSFEVEFLSSDQFTNYGDVFLDYAWNHVLRYGRVF